MKAFLLILFISLTPVFLQAQETESFKFSLEDCLNYAFKKNYNKQSIELSKESKAESYNQSKLERLPNLSASLSESFSNSKASSSAWNGNYGLNTSIPIFQGFSINNTIEQNKLLYEQSDYNIQQYNNQLTIQILQAFLTVLGNEELLKYQEEVIKTSQEQLKQGELQFKAGQILESDYFMLEAQYAGDYTNITDTKINRDNSILSLKNLLSMNPTSSLEITYPDTSSFAKLSNLPVLESVIQKTNIALPELKISQYNVDIAQVGVKLAKSSYYPSLDLRAGIGTGHAIDYQNYGTQLSDRLNEQVSLNLSIPIYNNNRTKTQVAKSKIQLKQAELDQKQTELNVLQDVTQEYQNVVSAYNKYNASKIKQNAYYKTFQAYNVKFNVGAITAVELLQQQNNYISAMNDYIQSKYGFILKRKILDVYMGEPISF